MAEPRYSVALKARLLEALALKQLPRAGWLRVGVSEPESVAAHSWGVAWLTLALCPTELDRARALAMAVLHDLAEVRTGDLTPHDRVSPQRKHQHEQQALRELLAPLAAAAALIELWEDYEAGASPEARFVRACDKLDMALQAQRYRSEQQVDTDEFVASALSELDDDDLCELVHAPAQPPRRR